MIITDGANNMGLWSDVNVW